jgi:hypothetical protein
MRNYARQGTKKPRFEDRIPPEAREKLPDSEIFHKQFFSIFIATRCRL